MSAIKGGIVKEEGIEIIKRVDHDDQGRTK
jgi:hypothetical protein